MNDWILGTKVFMIIEKFSKKRWKQKQSMVYGFIYEKKKRYEEYFLLCLTNDIDDQCIFLIFCFCIKFSHGDFSYFDTMFYPWHYTCTFSYLNQIKNLRSNQIIRMIVHFLFCKFHNMCFFLLIYWPFKERSKTILLITRASKIAFKPYTLNWSRD